jgi:hypothetical protein
MCAISHNVRCAIECFCRKSATNKRGGQKELNSTRHAATYWAWVTAGPFRREVAAASMWYERSYAVCCAMMVGSFQFYRFRQKGCKKGGVKFASCAWGVSLFSAVATHTIRARGPALTGERVVARLWYSDRGGAVWRRAHAIPLRSSSDQHPTTP